MFAESVSQSVSQCSINFEMESVMVKMVSLKMFKGEIIFQFKQETEETGLLQVKG